MLLVGGRQVLDEDVLESDAEAVAGVDLECDVAAQADVAITVHLVVQDAAVAGGVAIGLEFEPEGKIAVLAVGDEPDVVVLGVGHRVGENGAGVDLPEYLVLVDGPALDGPAGEVGAGEQRDPEGLILGGGCGRERGCQKGGDKAWDS